MKTLDAHMTLFLFLIVFSVPWRYTAVAADLFPDVISDHCPNKCGDVHVPYPFGINFTSAVNNDPKCSLNSFFMFTCNSTFSPPRLYFGRNMPINNISVDEGTISVRIDAAFKCYNQSGLQRKFSQNITLGGGPFRFSDSRNKLTTIGCDTIALMENRRATFGSGCISFCSRKIALEGSCSGFGCCQTPIPQNLKTLNIGLQSPNNHSEVLTFNPCEFAFLADIRTFNVSNLQLSARPFSSASNKSIDSDVVIEWVVREETCEVAQSNSNPNGYACGSNTNCLYSENGNGYRCSCKDGFTGNPYLPQGCQDIDECKEPDKYKCEGSCKNTVGNYTCECPLGMRGDGKVGCRGMHFSTIALLVRLYALIIVLVLIMYQRRKKERNFLENGGLLLKHQRVRLFTEAELAKATRNYDASQLLGEGGFGYVYKGVLSDNTQIAVKKPKDLDKAQIKQEYQHEMTIVSQVNHRNVVKILGLCLETKVPLLVYEFISRGTLFHHIHNRSQLLATWKNRLRVATETALALDYLHSLADPPIIHGDIKSLNILLDETYTVKVSDFGASVLISPGQSDIGLKIQGTFGYLDPEYLMTGILTEKSDIYSFGVILVELLTGVKPNSSARSGEHIVQFFLSSVENNNLKQILCLDVADEHEMEEIQVLAEIAKRCLRICGVKRPSMKEIAEELGRLQRSNENSWNYIQNNEAERLTGDSVYCSIDMGDSKSSQHELLSLRTSDM